MAQRAMLFECHRIPVHDYHVLPQSRTITCFGYFNVDYICTEMSEDAY
jgi:hypothetical protein